MSYSAEDEDFISNKMTITFLEEQSMMDGNFTFNVSLLNDDIVEGLEHFNVTLTAAKDAEDNIDFAVSRVTITILDDDGKACCLRTPQVDT